MQQSLIPQSLNLQELLSEIDAGELALPEFQRKYEWKLDAVKKLFDSILHNYPIGSLLFLSYKNQFCIKNFEGSPSIAEGQFPGNVVLDGQQRLTSVYQALYGKHKNGNFFIKLKDLYEAYRENGNNIEGLDFENFIEVKSVSVKNPHTIHKIDGHLLPFNLLKGSQVSASYNAQILSYRDEMISINQPKDYTDFIGNELTTILDPIFSCYVPVLELSHKLSMSAICRIFETLNTTGKSLDSFDICVAKFYKDFNIRARLDDALSEIDPVSNQFSYPFLGVFMAQNANRVYLLQVIALVSGKPHSKNRLAENLETIDIQNNWSSAIKGIDQALSFMKEYGACTDSTLALIPYQPSILVMASALVKSGYISNKLSLELSQKVPIKLRQYFFHSALDLRYGEGAMTKTKDDSDSLTSWLTGGATPDFLQKSAQWYPKDLLMLTPDSKGARINMIRCLMNIQHPDDFMTCCSVINPSLKTDLHHIFPFARYKDLSVKGYSIDTVFNKTYISSTTNRMIGSEHTFDYAAKIINEYCDGKESVIKDRLARHFIDDTAYGYFIKEDLDGFLESRSESMFRYLRDTIGISIEAVESQSEEDKEKVEDDLI